MTGLRDHLLDNFGGYADKRIRDRSLDRPIQIDDKGPHDVYPHFCTISARVPDRTGETLILTLRNCPCNDQVMSLIEKRGARSSPPSTARRSSSRSQTISSARSPAFRTRSRG